MLIRPLPTTPLQIFCENFLKLKVIVKSILGPDDFKTCLSWANRAYNCQQFPCFHLQIDVL